MNTITAQEIKRRGISAVKDEIKKGPVHVIMNNQPTYVIIDEKTYEEMIAEQEESYRARLAISLQELREGNTQTFSDVDDLMNQIEE